jgi:hypothetical protein
MFARREPEEKVPCMNVKRFVDHEMSVGEARVARTYPSLLYDPKILIQFSKLFLHSTGAVALAEGGTRSTAACVLFRWRTRVR